LSDLCNDIDLISPEQLTSIFVIGVSLANVQTANTERRMDEIHNAKVSEDQDAGSSGFSSAGFVINGSGPSFSEGFAGVSGPEGKSGGQPVFAPIPQNRWGVFVTGIGEFTNVASPSMPAAMNSPLEAFYHGYRLSHRIELRDWPDRRLCLHGRQSRQ
jgi:hypothetical protein